jgi:hypothetical protein
MLPKRRLLGRQLVILNSLFISDTQFFVQGAKQKIANETGP